MSEWTFVVRRVRNIPVYFKDDGRISSAVFKDSKGVSVNKDDLRDKEEIIEFEERLHDYYHENDKDNPDMQLKAIVSVNKNDCEEKGVLVINDPVEENIHHALLKRSRDEIRLSSSQAKALARSALMLKTY